MFKKITKNKKHLLYLKEFIKVLVKKNIKLLSVGFIFLLGTTIIGVIMPQIIQQIIDDAFATKDKILLLKLAVIYIILASIRYILQIGQEYNFSKLKKKISIKYKLEILKKISNLSGEYYSDMQTGKILNVLNGDCNALENYGMDLFCNIIMDLFMALFSIYFLISMEYELFLGVLILLSLITLIQKLFTKQIYERTKKIRKESGENYALETEYISNIVGIIIAKAKRFFMKNYIIKQRNFIRDNLKLDIIFASYNGAGAYLIVIITILIYGFGGIKIIDGNMTLGKLIVFQEYTIMFIGPCINLLKSNTKIKQMFVSLEQIYNVLNTNSEIKLELNSKKLKGNVNEIKFEGVSFFYKNNIVLQNINLLFEKGNLYALVGKSGCGKSTIVKLIFRLWDTTSGSILINNIPLQQYNLNSLRKHITIVSQELLVVDDTIRNNILMGNSKIDDKLLYHICDSVGIRKFIEQLPEGYETIIGERGTKMSGGQKQRIVIARALLNSSSIMIFDEATSALDNITQNLIFKNLQEYLHDKIVIFIAHRLSTIVNADKIFVLGDGNVKEYGTHKELAEQKGYYYEMLKQEL